MLIHGVTDDVALKVEASVIDIIDLKKLTNKVKAEDRWEFIGQIAEEKIRKKYLYKDVADTTNNQSPFYYLNIRNNVIT